MKVIGSVSVPQLNPRIEEKATEYAFHEFY